jgi:hypothetical protein
VVLALGDLLVVVGLRCRVAQGGERREEEGPFELLVSSPGRLFSAARGARAAGCRGESGVGGEVAGGREGAAVADLDQDAGSGPDADSRHRRQDFRKRVGVQEFLDPPGQQLALVKDGG